jgi:hypothetical protein
MSHSLMRSESIMHRFLSLAAVGILALGAALLLVSPLTAEAHETRQLDNGKYQIVVGFIDEPVFAGDKSGLEFFVTDLSTTATPVAGEQAAEGTAVEGLEETLKAEVIVGDQTMELPLNARYNTPGAYESVFFPMKPGDYTFRIYGKLGDTDIDESFTSSPEGFGAVEDPAPLQFPK